MIDALIKPIQLMIGKPMTLLPGLVAGILGVLLFYFGFDYLVAFIYDFIINWQIPLGGMYEVLFRLFVQFRMDVLTIIGFSAAFFIVMVWHIFTAGIILKGEKENNIKVASSMRQALGRFWEILGVGVFLFLLFVLGIFMLIYRKKGIRRFKMVECNGRLN